MQNHGQARNQGRQPQVSTASTRRIGRDREELADAADFFPLRSFVALACCLYVRDGPNRASTSIQTRRTNCCSKKSSFAVSKPKGQRTSSGGITVRETISHTGTTVARGHTFPARQVGHTLPARRTGRSSKPRLPPGTRPSLCGTTSANVRRPTLKKFPRALNGHHLLRTRGTKAHPTRPTSRVGASFSRRSKPTTAASTPRTSPLSRRHLGTGLIRGSNDPRTRDTDRRRINFRLRLARTTTNRPISRRLRRLLLCFPNLPRSRNRNLQPVKRLKERSPSEVSSF